MDDSLLSLAESTGVACGRYVKKDMTSDTDENVENGWCESSALSEDGPLLFIILTQPN